MTNITPIITNAGMNAIFQTEGTNFIVNISHIALGDVGGNLDGATTTLNNEVCRHEIAYSQILTANQLSISTNITGTIDFWVKELGIYLDDGTLFAYWTSQDSTLAHKTSNVDLLLSLNFVLTNVPTDNINIVNTGEFALPIATDTSAGIMSERRVNEIISSTLTGSVTAFCGQTIPNGWLLCDGSSLLRDSYSNLFNVIGTTYGDGIIVDADADATATDGDDETVDGEVDSTDTIITDSTMFNIPDLRGEFIRGFDDGRGIDVDRFLGSRQEDEFKEHEHYVYPAGSKGIYSYSFDVDSASSGNSISYPKRTSLTGGVETRPRNIALNYIIKY